MKHPVDGLLAEQLQRYADLVRRYHRTLDLMSERAIASLDTKIAESLVYADLIAPHLSPIDRILDVGSGVGLPGIPLALRFPTTQVVLVERRRKRASFLKIVVGQLGLEHVHVVLGDVQMLVPTALIGGAEAAEPKAGVTTNALQAAEVKGITDKAITDQGSTDRTLFKWVTAQAVGSFPLLYRLSSHLHNEMVTLISRRGTEMTPELEAEFAEVSRLAGAAYDLLSLPLPTHGRVMGLRFSGLRRP